MKKSRFLAAILSASLLVSSLTTAAVFASADTDAQVTYTNQSAIQAMRDSLTMTFHDEFGGDAGCGAEESTFDKTKWGYEYDLNGGTRNGEPQLYTCDDRTKNAWTEDGNLVIEGRRVTKDEVWYNADGTKQEAQQDANGDYYVLGNDGKSKYYFTSASLRNYWATFDGIEPGSKEHWEKLYNDYGFKYGMLEARIMFPEQSTETDETWPAFWTTGGSANGPEGELDSTDKTKNWPTAGEIDIAELFSKQYTMNQLVHYSPNYDGNHSTALAGGYNPSDNKASTIIRGSYHTYGIYYTDKIFMYYVDDVVCAVFDISGSQYDFFRKNPQFVFMNMAIGDMNTFGLGPNAAPNLTSAQLKVDYVRAYQATDDDYSHIKVLSVPTDTICSPQGSQNSWQPGTKSLSFGNGVRTLNVKPNNKIDEGKYDVFLTGVKAYWTVGAFDVSIDGSTYTGNADYTKHSESAETGEWYCDDLSTYVGTADIQNGAHNIQINLNRTKDPKNVIGCILRALILVGKSENDATVIIDGEEQDTTTTTTTTTAAAATTTGSQQTTTASTTTAENTVIYDAYDAVADGPNADKMKTAVAGEHTGFTGKGFIDYFSANGSSVTFTVDAPSAADYAITFRYESYYNTFYPSVYLDGVKINTENVAPDGNKWVAQGGSWHISKPLNVNLTAGTHEIKLVNEEGISASSGTIDCLYVTQVSADEPTAETSTTAAPTDITTTTAADTTITSATTDTPTASSTTEADTTTVVPTTAGPTTPSTTETTTTTSATESTTDATTSTTTATTTVTTTIAPTTTTEITTTMTTTVTEATTTTTAVPTTVSFKIDIQNDDTLGEVEQTQNADGTITLKMNFASSSHSGVDWVIEGEYEIINEDMANGIITVMPHSDLKISAKQPVLYGDANGDGKITAADVLIIRKSIAGQSVTLNSDAADVNCDGKLTAADVLMIRKYIAGQDIVLGAER